MKDVFIRSEVGKRPQDVRFAFLNLHGHPRGELICRRLANAGFVPTLVVEEESATAAEGRARQLEALRGSSRYRPVEATRVLCSRLNIPHQLVSDHNNSLCQEALESARPDWIVLGDTRVLKGDVIRIARQAVINSHPGLLPEVRGNHPYIWAAVEGLGQGASVHLVDEGVDTGPVIVKEMLSLKPPTCFGDLIQDLNLLCARLLVDTMKQMITDGLAATRQPKDAPVTRRAASPEIRARAIAMLQSPQWERAARNLAKDGRNA